MAKRNFKILRGGRERGEFKDYTVEANEGMVVLDALSACKPNTPTTSPSEGSAMLFTAAKAPNLALLPLGQVERRQRVPQQEGDSSCFQMERSVLAKQPVKKLCR